MGTIDIFEQVKDLILKSNMSISEIARRSGVSCRAIQYWLRNQRGISVDNAQCVLAVLGKELRVEDRSDDAKVSQ